MAHGNQPVFRRIAAGVREIVDADTTGHGMGHAWRVFRLGMRLADAEGADPEIVGAAALTHDVHRVMDDAFVAPVESLPTVESILRDAGFPAEKVPDVLYCVEVHERYSFAGDDHTPGTIEAAIVRDADNLDAMGAIGVVRAARFSASYDQALWNPDDDPVTPPGGYDKTDYSNTLIGHFHEKLLRLKDEMTTDAAADIAGDRHRFMESFVERFVAEWRGDR